MRRLEFTLILAARALAGFAGAAESPPPPVFTPPALRADLAQIDRALHEMPADLAHSVDEKQLAHAIQALDAKLSSSAPLTRDQAWREFATLNPLLADGHLFVGFVDWRGDTRAHLADGGSLFPLAVRVTADCRLSVREDPSGSTTEATPEAALVEVNGLAAHEICEQMMLRAHGETRTFRADLLSRRFWFFYWKMFGAPASFEITLVPGGRRTLEGGRQLPDLLAKEESFERQFHLERLTQATDSRDDGTAILTLASFAWPDKDQVLAFTRRSFETLRRWNTRALIIDLRDNGGGNDDQWIEGVMPYIASKPFRTASTYRKREPNGAIVDGEIQTWFPPRPNDPARFNGQLFVAVGPGTYSSAVVLSTVVQDFGFGKVVGSGGSVRANQSGGTRRTTLTNTGLIVVAPRFVLTRPSGAKNPVLLTPDIPWDADVTLARFPIPQR